MVTTIEEAKMKIEDLTIGQAREMAALFGSAPKQTDASAWEIGKGYLIRTVTMTNTGRLVAVTEQNDDAVFGQYMANPLDTLR